MNPPTLGAARSGRLLHLVSSFRWTGAAEPAAQLAQAQQALGRAVALALQPGGAFEERALQMGLEVEASLLRRRAGPLALWRAARRLRAMGPELQAVHCHLTADHWLTALALGSRKDDKRRPLLIRTFHREETPRGGFASRWLVRQATDGAIAISSSLAERLRETYNLPPERVLVAGGVVDAEAFSPGGDGPRMRAAWGIPQDAPLAGLLCRVRASRGVFVFLDAVEPLLKRVPEAHLVFCGRGRHAAKLKAAIERHPQRDRIHFPGYVRPADLRDAYAAFDAAVQLAPGNDGTCRAALQSMACGRPLVATRVGALADLLTRPGGGDPQPEDGGLLVAPNSPEDLAQALAIYLENPSLRAVAGEAGRRSVAENCRPQDRARQILEFIDGLRGS
jgi:glycosyltransferase involved in cell wall biosynthesis